MSGTDEVEFGIVSTTLWALSSPLVGGGVWTTPPRLANLTDLEPLGRARHASTVVEDGAGGDGTLVVAGGTGPGGIALTSVDALDLKTGTWTSFPEYAVAHPPRLLVVFRGEKEGRGGRGWQSFRLRHLLVIFPLLDTAANGSLPVALRGHNLMASGGSLFVAGGYRIGSDGCEPSQVRVAAAQATERCVCVVWSCAFARSGKPRALVTPL